MQSKTMSADLTEECKALRGARAALTDAADAVGVRHFDTDWLDDDVQAMKEATVHARHVLLGHNRGN